MVSFVVAGIVDQVPPPATGCFCGRNASTCGCCNSCEMVGRSIREIAFRRAEQHSTPLRMHVGRFAEGGASAGMTAPRIEQTMYKEDFDELFGMKTS